MIKKQVLGAVLSLLIVTPVGAQVATTAPQGYKAEREAARTLFEQKRDELKGQLETAREDLKKQLGKIKDERKKQTVERMSQQLADLNMRRTDHFLDVLDKLGKVVTRIQDRAQKAADKGLDVATVKAAIADAQKAIADSQAAVKAQALKIYKVTISTENRLKLDVGKAVKALQGDLSKTQETVKAARQAVQKAAVALAQIAGKSEADKDKDKDEVKK